MTGAIILALLVAAFAGLVCLFISFRLWPL